MSIDDVNYIQITLSRYHDVNIKQAKLEIKFDLIIQKIDLY